MVGGHGKIKSGRYYLNEWHWDSLSKKLRDLEILRIYFCLPTILGVTPWMLASQGRLYGFWVPLLSDLRSPSSKLMMVKTRIMSLPISIAKLTSLGSSHYNIDWWLWWWWRKLMFFLRLDIDKNLEMFIPEGDWRGKCKLSS